MNDEELEPQSFSATLKSQFAVNNINIEGNLLSLTTDTTTYVDLATYLKEQDFVRCLTVSATDWLDQNEFEIYYLVHQLKNNIYLKVAVRIPRNNPEITSLSTVWESAAMHEREMWELFGINFIGNTMLKPLFLEDWTKLPPLRKDFNWRDYVAQEYYKVEED
jgi:NADH-quinone oxidoreductase subunit C